ncbi:hypothetical protein [Paludibaculum fermentans]|uniref:hypothetical protein n=1 Tax=Paludibaculum fermentans TaxID=1473598 RepID=UPI003EBEB822
MPCPELNLNAGLRDRFNRHRFDRLHYEGRRIISHWFRLAQEKLDCDPAESFEPFIYAWIAFNGWASCCTELDQDRQIIEALSNSTELTEQFGQAVTMTDAITESAARFWSTWPVFNVKDLRRRRIPMFLGLDRSNLISHYFQHAAGSYAPRCYRRHLDAEEAIPLDWPHTIWAIYQVRCNLFHGDKSPHSETDQVLVHSGLQVLVQFLTHSGYIA